MQGEIVTTTPPGWLNPKYARDARVRYGTRVYEEGYVCISLSLSLSLSLCVCVCVCVCAKEREGGG